MQITLQMIAAAKATAPELTEGQVKDVLKAALGDAISNEELILAGVARLLCLADTPRSELYDALMAGAGQAARLRR